MNYVELYFKYKVIGEGIVIGLLVLLLIVTLLVIIFSSKS